MKKYIIVGGIVVVLVAGFLIVKPEPPFGADTISLSKVATLYNQATDIKSKYQLNEVSLVKTDIKNAEPDKYKGEPKDEVKVTIGDNLSVGTFGAETQEFKPNIELKRWNEVSFKLKTDELLKDVATKYKKLSFDKDKIKFDTPKLSFEMYSVDEGEGSYKYIWYLNEKPATNKVEFQIESSGLDFFYQPPLTQEYQNGFSQEFQKEIVVSETQVKDLEGNVLAERPENVVGSYAVYHSTKGGMNDAYGKDYKTGKAFHIFRPHIIDSSGAETWGILKIENGIYSVEIPQEFLDKAVYPIKSNDTFGFESVGASANLHNLSQWPMRWLSGSKYASGGSGDLDSITTYITKRAGPTWTQLETTFQFAIYEDGTDGVKVDTTDAHTCANGDADGWFTLNAVTGASLTSQDYWLYMWSGGTYDYYLSQYFDETGGDSRVKENTASSYSSWPSTLDDDDFSGDYYMDANGTLKFSIYATYTAGGGGAVIEDDPQIIITD